MQAKPGAQGGEAGGGRGGGGGSVCITEGIKQRKKGREREAFN